MLTIFLFSLHGNQGACCDIYLGTKKGIKKYVHILHIQEWGAGCRECQKKKIPKVDSLAPERTNPDLTAASSLPEK